MLKHTAPYIGNKRDPKHMGKDASYPHYLGIIHEEAGGIYDDNIMVLAHMRGK